jgi:hypothetical protein
MPPTTAPIIIPMLILFDLGSLFVSVVGLVVTVAVGLFLLVVVRLEPGVAVARY